MTDDILKYIDDKLEEWSAKNESPETGYRYGPGEKLPIELHLEALRVAVTALGDCYSGTNEGFIETTSRYCLKEITTILGVK
jgi:hypothetical protein